jgi:nucleoside-diphosphate-sugar epimerase
MKVLLTGATGFLGRAVARQLAARGHSLRVLARPSSRLAGLPDGCEVVAGDVTDGGSLQRAASGCEAVVHMAALVKVWVPDPERFDAVNVGGLRHVLDAARAAGARLVYTSSFMALGPSGDGAVDGERPHPGPPFRNAYERTKANADRLAREAAAAGQDVVIVYPGVIYGPGDMTEGNIVARLVADHLNGRLPALVVRVRRGRRPGPRAGTRAGRVGRALRARWRERDARAVVRARRAADRCRPAAPQASVRSRLGARPASVAMGRADRQAAPAHARRGRGVS